MPLREMLTSSWAQIQDGLFPWLAEELGPLMECHRRLVTVLEVACIEAFVRNWSGLPGRPAADRQALARAFVAKAVLGLPQTNLLIERLQFDNTLRRLCGWQRAGKVPSEATFSRAFAEFAASELPSRVHEALIKRTLGGDHIVGHISRDATAIEAREKPERREQPQADGPKRKRGRPRKGEVVPPKEPRRLERQATMTQAEMTADLPTHCSVGAKRNAKGYKTSWIGYKLHIATADGDIPVACMLTSAPRPRQSGCDPAGEDHGGPADELLRSDGQRLRSSRDRRPQSGARPCADLDHRTRRGEKPAIAAEALAKVHANYLPAEDVRTNQRSSAERVNSLLKDNAGGNHVRVRGAAKVLCHLTLGLVAITVEQLLRLVV